MRAEHVAAPSLALVLASSAVSAQGGYSSYAEMRADFYGYAATYAHAEVHVFGFSVQGRELFGLKISDNAAVEEPEPPVVFWGAIHGDESASAEVPYLYALELCDTYGTDPKVTAYVDDHEIWCIPLVNPDGYELGTRNNVNNVDLNRDLGFNWDGWGGSPAPYSQPETQAVRAFLLEHGVKLSVTHHCSGNIFLHPWGYSGNAPHDLGIILDVGASYAAAASYTFLQSWADYQTHGELLDSVYGLHGGLCYTSEISNSLAALPTTYARNKAGMDAFLDRAGSGLSGTVTDAVTGAPIHAAMWVSGSGFPTYTDATLGDVHRLVEPGTYDLTFWANGYAPTTLENVVVGPLSVPAVPFQVSLQPGGNEHAFRVTSVNQDDPNNTYNNQSLPADALGAPDGVACSIGSSGFLVLDVGEGHAITDGPGVDFTVTEALVAGDPRPEAYDVYAGGAVEQSTLIGSGVGTTSFDLGAAGVSSTRYLRIVDRSGSDPDLALAGVEVDALTVLNGSGGPSLAADVGQISVATGGAQTFTLQGPTANAPYWILGTTAGTSPGQTLVPTAKTLPLNYSAYFLYSILHPNVVISSSFDFLDASGGKTAVLTVPAGLDPSAVGLAFDHAYFLADPVTFAATFVSNTVPLTLVP